jgi:protein SCO1/2
VSRSNRAITRPLRALGFIVCFAFGLAAGVGAREGGEAEEADPHAHHHHHHQAQTETTFVRSVVEYALPDVELVRADGTAVRFPQDMDDGRPVVLQFIYTTCTAICPMLSQTFSSFQKKLGDEVDRVRMVSISIDPEEDTPDRLTEYAARYRAGPQWSYYTGTLEASVAVQKAFQAYYGDKMNHRPVAFLRAAPGKPWVRLEGFATPDDLVREHRRLVAGG